MITQKIKNLINILLLFIFMVGCGVHNSSNGLSVVELEKQLCKIENESIDSILQFYTDRREEFVFQDEISIPFYGELSRINGDTSNNYQLLFRNSHDYFIYFVEEHFDKVLVYNELNVFLRDDLSFVECSGDSIKVEMFDIGKHIEIKHFPFISERINFRKTDRNLNVYSHEFDTIH